MLKQLKTWISKGLLLTTLVTQSSLLAIVGTPAAAAAADTTPVVINELSPAGDWIELFASRDVNFNDAQGWTLVTNSGASVRLSGTMTPGQFKSFTFATAPLGPSNGSVKLTHDGVDADVIRWGNERGADVPGVTGDNTIARSDNGSGRWISNVTATQDASNASAMSGLPPVPSTVKVPATSASPVNAVNNASQSNVTVQAGYSGTATLNVAIGDSKGGNTAVSTAAGDSMDGGSVTGLDASALADGTLFVRAYTDASGKRSAWTTQISVKDTIAPATPAPFVLARTKNGQNVINANNVSDVRVSIGTPGADASSLTATLTDTAAGAVSGSLPLDGSRGLDARTLVDGSITLSVTVSDVAGNVSAAGTATPGKDTVAPIAPSNATGRDASGMVVLGWTASSSSDLGSYRIYGDLTTGSIDPNSPLGEVSANTTEFTTKPVPNGKNAFRIQAVDRFGNEETTGTVVYVSVSGPLETEALSATSRKLDLTDPLRLVLTISDKTSGAATVSVSNLSTNNPTTVSVPDGHVAVGKYFELGTNNQTIFPLEIKLYYTLVDLKNAGASEERMLEGIRFYDRLSKSWKLYGETGVNTTDVKIGNLDFAGYVWARADHLTPIIMSADIAAPSKPGNFFATAGDGRVVLHWDRVSDTAGYQLRFRQATNDDTTAYQTVFVNGGDVTSATLKGFENGVLYEFGVASVDWVGNKSHSAVVEQTPVAAGSSADFVVPTQAASKPAPSGSSALIAQAGGTSDSGSSSNSTGTTTPSTDSSAVGGSVDGTNQATTPSAEGESTPAQTPDQTKTKDTAASNSRTLVTILIIVIAAAAGFGGYYGYQWWMSKPEVMASTETPSTEESKKKPEKPNGSGSDQGGRW